MIHATRSLTLLLLSSSGVLAGYSAYDGMEKSWAHVNQQWMPTTGPAGSGGGGHSGSGSYYHHTGTYWHSSGGWGGDEVSGSSGHSASGTARGGFGHSGHGSGS